MNAEIICVGTELLLGHILNTNARYISKKLASLGINLYYQSAVGDNPERLVSLLRVALSRSELVFTTGGLGPTVDDITLSAVSGVCGRNAVLNRAVLKEIKDFFRKKGFKNTPKAAFKQAYIPEGAKWFRNAVGTAQGVLVKYGGSSIIALPGPPRELEPMFENKIIPYIKRHFFTGGNIIKTRTLKITGMVESHVNDRVKELLSLSGDTTVGIYTSLGKVELKITSRACDAKTADKRIGVLERKIRTCLKENIYGADDDTLESVVGVLLKKRKKSIALAESCTGGLTADRITDVEGSSRYFKMGVVAYSNTVKEKALYVRHEKISKYGAVSKEVAHDMADGIKKASGADIAVGITGIAGPAGGTKSKPVGLVYISVINGKMANTQKCYFSGSRKEIKWQTSSKALDLVRRVLL